jgi:hypothetical protein
MGEEVSSLSHLIQSAPKWSEVLQLLLTPLLFKVIGFREEYDQACAGAEYIRDYYYNKLISRDWNER